MSSGTSGRRSWNRCASQLERGAEQERGKNGKFRARPMQSGRTKAKKLHADWWQQRIARQKEIDASIAAKAEFEYLYDKPYEDKKKVRVAGPFTVESLSPHRVLGVDENDELIDALRRGWRRIRGEADLPSDDPGEPEDRRRAAGAQGRQDHLHRAHAVAGRLGLRRRPLHGRRRRRSAPPSSSARNSAPSSAPTSSPPRARPATPASMC